MAATTTKDIYLTREQVPDAAAIQAAIDAQPAGGRVVLPEMDLTLDRGLELRSGTELVGQGVGTILRKGPGRIFPLNGYHNYGMCDVPLISADGLVPGMTVSVLDDERSGFYETLARITWIDGNWVGLDHGIEDNYRADCRPRLTTAYPLVFGHGVEDVALRNLTLEGNRSLQEVEMGACRGAAVYFAKSRGINVSGVHERDYSGEGIGFQMCRDMVIRDCVVEGNAGNGLHPGAGSTNCLFEGCASSGNDRCGFFFCVRANRITVKGCCFDDNRVGVSIGTRDCHNLIAACRVRRNRESGLHIRGDSVPLEVHSCEVTDCEIASNGSATGTAQVVIPAAAHDLILRFNRIDGAGITAGIEAAPGSRRLYFDENVFTGCAPEVVAVAKSLADQAPRFERGHGEYEASAFRHLPGPRSSLD